MWNQGHVPGLLPPSGWLMTWGLKNEALITSYPDLSLSLSPCLAPWHFSAFAIRKRNTKEWSQGSRDFSVSAVTDYYRQLIGWARCLPETVTIFYIYQPLTTLSPVTGFSHNSPAASRQGHDFIWLRQLTLRLGRLGQKFSSSSAVPVGLHTQHLLPSEEYEEGAFKGPAVVHVLVITRMLHVVPQVEVCYGACSSIFYRVEWGGGGLGDVWLPCAIVITGHRGLSETLKSFLRR